MDDPLIQRIKKRGGNWGVRSLRLHLSHCDKNGDAVLDLDDFIGGLRRYGIGTVTFDQLERAFGHCRKKDQPQAAAARGGSAASRARPESVPFYGRTQYSADYPTARGGPDRLSISGGMKKKGPPTDFNVDIFAVMHTVCGDLARERLKAISTAFQSIQETVGSATPTVEQIMAEIGIDKHPDVVSSAVTVRDALFCAYSAWGVPMDHEVSEELFIQYFADWSVSFRHDADFSAFMVNLFGRPSDSGKKARRCIAPTRKESDKLFDSIDTNKNGTLSLAELDLAVLRLYPSMNYKPAIMRAYKLADTSGNGWLDKAEFVKFLQYLVIYNELREQFALIDTDNSRSLTLDEMKANKQHLGMGNLSDVAVRNLFKAIDVNNGGKILFDEFCMYMAKRNGDLALAKDTNQY